MEINKIVQLAYNRLLLELLKSLLSICIFITIIPPIGKRDVSFFYSLIKPNKKVYARGQIKPYVLKIEEDAARDQ